MKIYRKDLSSFRNSLFRPTIYKHTGRKRAQTDQKQGKMLSTLLSLILLFNIIPQHYVAAQEGGNLYLPLINSGGAETNSPQADPTLSASGTIVDVQQLGDERYLVAGPQSGYPGVALYTFADDEEGAPSRCSQFCAMAWPPLTVRSADEVRSLTGVDAQLGTIQRDDGTLQVTYDMWPLYRYAGDPAADPQGFAKANGNGIDGLWWRVKLAVDTAAADEKSVISQSSFSLPASRILTSFAEAGSVKINQINRTVWHTVPLEQGYANPVVITQPLSHYGGDPAAIRIKNITHQSFQVQIDEWQYLNGMHTTETLHYMVVDAGVHTWPGSGGQKLVAGIANVDHTFTTVPFNHQFAATPIVLSQVQSVNDAQQVITRQRLVTAADFQLRLQEEQASDGTHPTEMVGYIAMAPGQVHTSGRSIAAGLTPNIVTRQSHEIIFGDSYIRPTFLAAMQTFDGADPATLRYTELTEDGAEIFVQEEQSADSEMGHTTEAVGYIVIGKIAGDPPVVSTPTPTPTPIIPQYDSTILIVNGGDIQHAYETGTRATIEIKRYFYSDALEVSFKLFGATDPAKGSATADDYIIRDSDGNQLDDHVDFAIGQMSEKITVEAIADEQNEVPEMLRLKLIQPEGHTLVSEASEATVMLSDDEAGITSSGRVILAQMTANGVQSGATGMAVVRLSNDNSYGLVSINFSGLTSLQTSAHIHYLDSTPIVFSIDGVGQVQDERWDIEAAYEATTDQAMLDKLFSGHLDVNIHSETFPDGEIRGVLQLVNGAVDMPSPPMAPALEQYPYPDSAELKRDISRFLTQATFGPSAESFADMEDRIAQHNGDRMAAYEEWIDDQLALNAPSLLTFGQANMQFHVEPNDGIVTDMSIRPYTGFRPGWYTSAIYAKAQLRERVAFSLSNIFVISTRDSAFVSRYWSPASYYDVLKENAFGSFETLLTDVSLHPAMASYLSMIRNQAERVDAQGTVIASPDENFAREVMQLFSIGLLELHLDGSLKLGSDGLPIRTYDQDDITELARVFTGWSYGKKLDTDGGETPDGVYNDNFFYSDPRPVGMQYYRPNRTSPMRMFIDSGHSPNHVDYVRYHDNGEKNWLGNTLPAGQSGELDMAQAMNVLSNHPNTAVFISRQLIQRMVTSNPSAGYTHRVASKFESTDGDLGQVIKAILLDPEARNLSMTEQIGYGKVKAPLLQMMGLFRLIGAGSNRAEEIDLTSLLAHGYPQSEVDLFESRVEMVYLSKSMAPPSSSFEQDPLNAPSVFNWFRPDFAPPGAISDAGLVAPELQLLDENNSIGLYNALDRFLFNTNGIVGTIPQNGDNYGVTRAQKPDWMLDTYMAVMDSDGNGTLTSADAAFSDSGSVYAASEALIDGLDYYLCAGRLTANATGLLETDAREILIRGVVDTWKHFDHNTSDKAHQARDNRVLEALYLVTSAPQCLFTE